VALAVAPLANDASRPPQRTVVEAVPTADLPGQLEALAAHQTELWRGETTRAGDTTDSLLKRMDVADPAAATFLRHDTQVRRAIDGRAGRLVQARVSEQGRLLDLIVRSPAEAGADGRHAQFVRTTVSRVSEEGFSSVAATLPLQATPLMASGTIRTSLYAATDEARLPDAVAQQLAEIFAVDIDFHRQLRRGDSFHVIYESLAADGEAAPWAAGGGRVLAAEFISAGRTHTAVWFEQGRGKGAYFDAAGRSRKRSFLASPLEFSRVSSGFAMRMHPILQRWRAHLGVDYAAPSGTPVRSVGDGVVESAGWQNGYGNVVVLNHGNDKQTLYAHLSRMDVRKGQRIEQGQRLGAVGATGWATGPHLHFEFRVRGLHQDPLQIAKAGERPEIETGARTRFAQTAARMMAKLDVAETLGPSRAAFE
jgi:murein DD-endopeptidase MepM/ murein hydrolase activator NlpD